MGANPWTPGPWEQYAYGTTVHGADGFLITSLQSKRPKEDARLIAAAPEMAEVLSEFVATWDKFYQQLPRDAESAEFGVVQNARVLLARIRGDAP
jgi:hypothetical protein